MADEEAKGKKGKKGDDEEGGGKGKSNLVPAIVLALGLAAGGYFMGGGGGETKAEAAAAAKEEKAAEAEAEPGEVSEMDALSINLAEDHFLKVGVGVELTEDGDPEVFKTAGIPMVKDALIDIAGGGDVAVLSTKEGREQLKDELMKKMKKKMPGTVKSIYFTEFVTQ